MPPLLCGSPCILDQSFPRNTHELHLVVDTLGELEQLVSQDRVHLVLTEALADLVTEIDWQTRGHQYPLLIDIYRLLNVWFLQPHERLIMVDTSNIQQAPVHPLPRGISDEGWASLWAEEIGKMLVIHDSVCKPGFCVGIACEQAFTTGRPNAWQNDNRSFPLVGPAQIPELEDAYEWESPPSDLHQKLATLADAVKNVHLLGATAVDQCDGDSHYKVHFPGSRPWTLDFNVDPVPEKHVGELVAITGLPLPVIRTALVYGYMPRKNILRLRQASRVGTEVRSRSTETD